MMITQQMLQTGRFVEFINEVIKIRNEEIDDKALWEFYLHRIYDNSFSDFKAENERIVAPEATKNDLETTVKHSFEMMKNFIPD